MSVMEYDPPTMTRGDLSPDMEVVLGDNAGVANFSTVTPEMVTMLGTIGATVAVNDTVDDVEASPDGKTLRVTRAWEVDEVEVSGRMWVSFRIDWPGTKPQHFPEDTPLILYIRPAPGDA